MHGRFVKQLLWISLATCFFFIAMSTGYDAIAQQKEVQTVIIKILPPKEAFELIQKNTGNKNFVIIDIRTPEEFASGHIQGAINMNYHSDTFIDDLNKLDKTRTYLVYCRTGRRSSDGVSIMIRLGFKDIYRIQGDIVRWKAEGLPVIKSSDK